MTLPLADFQLTSTEPASEDEWTDIDDIPDEGAENRSDESEGNCKTPSKEVWNGTENTSYLTSPTTSQYPQPMMHHSSFPLTPRPRRTIILSPLPRRSPRDARSSPPPVFSSPITGTKEERKAKIRKKARKRAEEKKQEETKQEKAAEQKQYDEILKDMEAKNIRFGDFLEYVFDPLSYRGNVRWHNLFARPGSVTQFLDWWAWKYSDSVRKEVSDWAVSFVCKLIRNEMALVTANKFLQTRRTPIGRDILSRLSFTGMHDTLSKMAPVTIEVVKSAVTAPRAEIKHSFRRRMKTQTVVTSVILTCLGEYSQANNLFKRGIGLWLYSTGAQRQTHAVLSSLGITESYSHLVLRRTPQRIMTTPSQQNLDTRDTLSTPIQSLPAGQGSDTVMSSQKQLGTLFQLSESMRNEARTVAASGTFGVVYDNINMTLRSAEQVIGRHDSQENGTCATVFPLWKADLANLDAGKLKDAIQSAPPLTVPDILLSKEEEKSFRQHLIYTILHIIVMHGGDCFQRFQKDLNANQPSTNETIEVHKTPLYPLPAMNIDESTIIGNAQVDEAIVKELNLSQQPEFWKRIHFQAGDQLSLARLRANEMIHAGEENEYNALDFFVLVNGLFYAKIADTHGMLETHFGSQSDIRIQDPGSLLFHNTHLDHLPITLSSLPTFRTCRDLVFVSLYAHVLHCLLLITGASSLEECAESITSWDGLVPDMQTQRQSLTSATSEKRKGDMVFENASLFLRDALILREFTDAKAGDSGHVILVLKTWALAFHGNGRTKYAYEMLHTIHNINHVFPPEIRKIVLNNWLANPTGKPNAFVELDLVQEHLNFWIKTFYKSHGSNASWDWLEHVSPCVEVLHKLASDFHATLGSDQGVKHADANLTKDIQTLMESLDDYDIYQIQPGRVLKGAKPMPDVIAVGFQSLTAAMAWNPLDEYNTHFKHLQQCHHNPPVTAEMVNRVKEGSQTSKPTNKLPLDSRAPAASALYTEESITSHNEEDKEEPRMDVASTGSGTVETDNLLPWLDLADVAFDMDIVECLTDKSTDNETDNELV
ncbi:hypothetical protein AN958_02062 [Leucoagaricus sp. SymC.cos]|nr:hypothetical protein AN958_02062 [Leucoagaricus sp. SymC.cos]